MTDADGERSRRERLADVLRRVPAWGIVGALVLVIAVAVVFIALTDGDDTPIATGEIGGSASTMDADGGTVSESGEADAPAGSEPDLADPGDPAESADSDPTDDSGSTDDDGSEAAPVIVWEPDLELTVGAPGASTDVRADWTPSSGAGHYTFRLDWTTPDDTGGDFGEIDPGSTSYTNGVPCGAAVEFAIVGWSPDDVEIGRGSASAATGDCPVPPSDLTASAYIGHSVAFTWNPGSGYDRYAWQATFSGTRSGTDSGVIADIDQNQFTVEAHCGTSIDFFLFAVMEDGHELIALRRLFDAAPCPETEVVYGNNYVVAPGTGNGRTATCPLGTALLSGGYRTFGDSGAMPYPGWVYGSLPNGTDDGWTSLLMAPPEREMSIQSIALCGVGVETAVYQTQIDLPAGGFRSNVTTCPPGLTISGGGFYVEPAGPNILVNARDGNGWRVSAYNDGVGPRVLRVYAICVEGEYVEVQEASTTFSVADGETNAPGGMAFACPAGWITTGGGFASADAVFEAVHAHGDPVGWVVIARNQAFAGPPGPTVAVEASALCLRFPP